MDTDLLDLGSDGASADNDDPYSRATGIVRRPVLSTACTMTPGSRPGVSVDNVEPVTSSLSTQPVVAQSSNTTALPWPDPPAAHSTSLHSEHYKSPGTVNDGVSAAGVIRPAPELLPKSTAAVPAIPPRKPRLAAPNLAPGKPEPATSKANQVQPPLPHIRKSTADSKTTIDSFVNRMYGVSMAVKPPQHSAEVNGNPPPMPVPRNVAVPYSAQTLVSASSNPTAVPSDGPCPVPCETLYSDEQVCRPLIVEV